LLVVIVVVLAALLAHNYVHTGRLTLVPPPPFQAEQQLGQLEKRFDRARAQFEQPGRAAGISGVDTSADAEAARREVERIDAELKALRNQLEDADKLKADEPKDKVEESKKELR
jgi:uncharacterized membrane protein YccC